MSLKGTDVSQETLKNYIIEQLVYIRRNTLKDIIHIDKVFGPRFFENTRFFMGPNFIKNKLIKCDFAKVAWEGTGPPPHVVQLLCR